MLKLYDVYENVEVVENIYRSDCNCDDRDCKHKDMNLRWFQMDLVLKFGILQLDFPVAEADPLRFMSHFVPETGWRILRREH